MEPRKPPTTTTLSEHLKRLASSNRLVPPPPTSVHHHHYPVTASFSPSAAAAAPEPPVPGGGEQRGIKNGTILAKNKRKMMSDDAEYIDSFPAGIRFCPTDVELIVHYLGRKLNNLDLPPTKIVDADLYKHHPQFLSEKHQPVGDNEWYFFTPRDRKYPNGQRPNRKAGEGFWKATGADKLIKPSTSDTAVIGYRKALVFYEGKAPKGDRKTNWIMHEFRVAAPPREKKNDNDMQLDEWVLCRLYQKGTNIINVKNRRGLKEEKRQNISALSNGLKNVDSTSDTADKPNNPFHIPARLPDDLPPWNDVFEIPPFWDNNSLMHDGGGRCNDNLLQAVVSSCNQNYGAHRLPVVEPLHSMVPSMVPSTVPASGSHFPADSYAGSRYQTSNSWYSNSRGVQFQGGSRADMKYFTAPFGVAGIRNKHNSGLLDHSDGQTSRLVRMDQILTAAPHNQPMNNLDSSATIPPPVNNVGINIGSLNQLANPAAATNFTASYLGSAAPVANNFTTIHTAGTILADQSIKDQSTGEVQDSAIK